MAELTWETQNDWDAAQFRNGVISRGIGDNVGDTFALGYDPNYGPLSDAVTYYTMDEASGELVDVVGGYNASTFGPTYGAIGPLGTSSLSFDGVDDYATANSASDPTGGGSFSVMLWLDKDTSSSIDTMIRGGATAPGTFFFDYRADDQIAFGFYDSNESLHWDAYFHNGTNMTGQSLLIGTYDESTGDLTVYYNDVADTASVSGPRPEGVDPLEIGRSAVSGAPRYMTGDIGSTILWDRALSSAEATTLYETLSGGSLTTVAQSDSGAAEEITVGCTIPSSTSASATVHASDGTTETVSLTDGTNTYTLSNFSSLGSDGSYWIIYDLSTSDQTVTPTIQTTTLSAATQHLFVVSMRANGSIIDIPVYDPANMSRSPVRFRNNSGTVGAARIIDHTTARMKVRHPTDGKLGLETKSR